MEKNYPRQGFTIEIYFKKYCSFFIEKGDSYIGVGLGFVGIAIVNDITHLYRGERKEFTNKMKQLKMEGKLR